MIDRAHNPPVWARSPPPEAPSLVQSAPPCAGLRFQGLPVEQVGLAVALAAADNPSKLPLRGAERKAVEGRQVGML